MNQKETKYTFHPRHRAMLAQWLDSYAQPDPVYPENIVTSIYYDTLDMDGLLGKVNSDYLKYKFRVRWYRDAATMAFGAAFAESKRKRGSTRFKDRIPLPDDPKRLDEAWLGDPRLMDIPRRLRKSHPSVAADLRPIIQIAYRRRRYVHAFTGTRLNLDWDIRPIKVSPFFSTFIDTTPLEALVFEVKGPDLRIPAPLTELMAVNGRREAYSKYYECCLSATRQNRR